LIDDKNQKQPAYFIHERFYRAMRRYVADFSQREGRVPSDAEFRQESLRHLATP
jgi:hypothetical protein